MSKLMNHSRLALLILFVAGSGLHSRAGTNAVTITNGFAATGAAAGVGFSFVATTNIVVTNVQIYDAALQDAIVSFWTSTNAPIASFDLGPTGNTHTVFSTNINFVVGAGEEYTITVQDGPSPTNSFMATEAYLPVSGAQIILAPELTGYHANLLTTNGQLTASGTNTFFFGVNFSYRTNNLVFPPLNIQLVGTNTVIVSWPSPSTGFVLQTNINLSVENWVDYTNTISDNGITKSVTNLPAAASEFFLLRPD